MLVVRFLIGRAVAVITTGRSVSAWTCAAAPRIVLEARDAPPQAE